MTSEAKQLYNHAKKIYKFSDSEVLEMTQKIAKLDESEALEARHLAEALQWTVSFKKEDLEKINPTFLFVGDRLGTELLDRAKDIGIAGIDYSFKDLVADTKARIQKLPPDSKQLLKFYAERMTDRTDIESRVGRKELETLNKILNQAEKTAKNFGYSEVKNEFLAEAMQTIINLKKE